MLMFLTPHTVGNGEVVKHDRNCEPKGELYSGLFKATWSPSTSLGTCVKRSPGKGTPQRREPARFRVAANSLAGSHLLRFKTVSSVLRSWRITCWRLLLVTRHTLAGSYQATP